MSGGIGNLAEKVGLPNLTWGLARLEAEERELWQLVDQDARGWNGSEHFKLGSIERLTVKTRLKLVQRLLAHPSMREQAEIAAQQFREAQERREREMQEERRALARRPSLTELVEREQRERRRAEMAAQKRREEAQWAAQPAKQVEDAPILFVGIEGVITSQPSHLRGLPFDRNCMALLAQLARVIGAKIILTAPARLSWRGGPDALWRLLQDEGWPADLWHDDWMLPAIEGRSTWQQLDAWLDGRDCEALIIDSQKNRYPGELADSIGGYYTYPPRGFEILDYHRILRRLGISDPKLPLPPPPAGTGFDHVPASWHGKPTAKPSSSAKAVPARGAGPSY